MTCVLETIAFSTVMTSVSRPRVRLFPRPKLLACFNHPSALLNLAVHSPPLQQPTRAYFDALDAIEVLFGGWG